MKLLKLIPDNTNIRFLRWRMPFYVVSVMLMVASLALVATKGLNFGVDFVGGQMIRMTFVDSPAAPIADLRERIDSLGYGEPSIQQFGQLAALTLPGIAGLVLTVGAAVDANVLINERIREERAKGRRVVQAVEQGYKESSSAIFDANITNVIAAVIMFMFGTGPIRGFAVVLMIGIVTSVFTAVTLTRMWVAGWLRRKRPADIVL